MAAFAKPGARFEMQHQSIDGDYTYTLWNADRVDNRYERATDTFVVRDGRIVAQSFAATIPRKT